MRARAAADGYTILFVSSSYVVNPSLYAKVPYDPYKDFIPLTMVGDIANTLIIHPSVPASSVKELVTVMKANPGKYNNFAHAGVGTTPHLSGELFRLTTGVDMVHVPFPGAGPAIQSTVAGHTPIMFTTLAPAIPQIKVGNLRALAVMAAVRSPVLPEVPTMAEAGFKDQEANTFVAALLPAGTPKPIVDLIYNEIIATLKLPDVRARFGAIGVDVVGNTSEEFAAQIKAEIAKWGKGHQGREDRDQLAPALPEFAYRLEDIMMFVIRGFVAFVALALAWPASAQQYPSKPVKISSRSRPAA